MNKPNRRNRDPFFGRCAALGIFVLAWSAVPARSAEHALPSLDENATLETYQAYAARNNAGLEASFHRWKAALERIPQGTSLPDPRVNYTYFIEKVETRVGPQRQKFGVSQMFPWFGKRRLQGDAATEAAAAARQDFEASRRSLRYRVTMAYHENWYLTQAIGVTKEHLQWVTALEDAVRSRYQNGAAPFSALMQAQVELGTLEDRLRTLESRRGPIVAQLNAALNRPAELPLPEVRSLPEVSATFTDEQVLRGLAESSPDLRRLDHRVRQEEAGLRLARKNYYPDVTLSVDVVDTGEAMDPSMPDSGKDPVAAMLSVTVPLGYGKYRAAEREARYRETAAESDRREAGHRLESEVQLALYRFRDAERKIALYGEALIPRAEQSLAVARQEFETGRTSYTALIDAERMLLEFKLEHSRAQADRGQRWAEVERLAGKDADAFSAPDVSASVKTTAGASDE